MIQLTNAFVNEKTQNYVNSGANLLVHFSNMSFADVSKLLFRKHMIQRDNVFISFNEYEYLDELFLNDSAREQFEEMMFQILENKKPNQRFVYFVFKIKSSDIDNLIHNGFYEWIEYWMLFFKFTHINLIFEINSNNFTQTKCPLAYEIVKKIDNPRLSLCINNTSTISKGSIFPEDINAYVLMFYKNEFSEMNQFPYAKFYVNL